MTIFERWYFNIENCACGQVASYETLATAPIGHVSPYKNKDENNDIEPDIEAEGGE